MSITKCGNGPSAASGFACNGRASGLVSDGKLLPQSQGDHQKPPNPKTQLTGDITQPQSKHGPRHKWDLPPLWDRASYSDPFHHDLPSPRTQQTSAKGVKCPLSFLRQCQAFHTRWAVGLLAGQERLGAHRQPPHSGHALAVGANPFEVPPKATWRNPPTVSTFLCSIRGNTTHQDSACDTIPRARSRCSAPTHLCSPPAHLPDPFSPAWSIPFTQGRCALAVHARMFNTQTSCLPRPHASISPRNRPARRPEKLGVPWSSSLPPGLLGFQRHVLLLKSLTSSSVTSLQSPWKFICPIFNKIHDKFCKGWLFSFLQHTNTAHNPPLGWICSGSSPD